MGNLMNKQTDTNKDDVYHFNIKIADKIREIVKDHECGYCRHPEFSESILILKETKKVISSDEDQWYFNDSQCGWTITELYINHHLTLDEYVKKYCTFHKFGEFMIPVYDEINLNK
jgi:hypothetical protein